LASGSTTASLLGHLLENAPVILWAVDREGIFRLSAGRGLRRLGRRPGQVVGLSVFEYYSNVPEIAQNVRRALSGEEFTTLVRVGRAAFHACYIPLRDRQGEVIGVLGISTDVTEQVELADGLQRRNLELEAVYAVDRATAERLDLDEVLQVGLRAILKTLDFDEGAVFLLDPEEPDTLVLAVRQGGKRRVWERAPRMRLGEGVAGRAVAERRAVVMSLAQYPISRIRPAVEEAGLQWFAAAPLIASNQVLGAISLAATKSRRLTEDEEAVLVSVGIQLGGAVYRAKLYQEVQQRQQALEARLRELTALNTLFQQYLQERDKAATAAEEIRSRVEQFLSDLDQVIHHLRA
jgi:PAS domain S-box-containing protein